MSFKLGYSSLQWPTPDLEKVLAQIKAAGWDGVELRQSLDWLGTPRHVRQICDNIGLHIAAVTARDISLDKDFAMLEMNKRRIDFAAEVGADVFMFMGAAKREGGATDEEITALAGLADEFAYYASQYDLDVCYHIHAGTTIDSIEDWASLMSKIKKCKLCIDVSHSALWGCSPPESIRHYKERLVYLHLQDAKGEWPEYKGTSDTKGTQPQNFKYEWVELGEGNLLDFQATLEALKEIGYNRWLVVCPGRTNRTDEEKMKVNRDHLRRLGY